MGVVFQSYALFPHMTVAQNIGFGLRVRGMPSAEAAARISDAVRLVRLDGLERRRPRQLSGGQQQRVALARALIIAPDVLLLDEPLSNLDAKLREEMRTEIRDIQRRLGITTIFVTHDQAEAMALSDRIAVLNEGRLAQTGTPDEVFERPASAFVARFIGRVNEWAARVEPAPAGGHSAVRFPDGRVIAVARELPKGPDVRVMVRPHLIEVRTPGGPGPLQFAGIVRRRTFIGGVVELEIESDGVSIIAEARPGRDVAAAFAIGQAVELGWNPVHTMVFPA
jgi:putative spermidine/putrescine transport system ATP-binding protein